VGLAVTAVYEDFTGEQWGYTSDPVTGRMTGPFPDALAAVFETLHIDASVTDTIHRLSKKRSKKVD